MHLPFVISALLLGSAASLAQNAVDLVRLGDDFDRAFEPAKALGCYIPAETLEPTNVPLLLRIARQYRHLMTDATTSAEKLRLGGIALGYGQRAAVLAPNDSEAQLSPTITYGKMLPLQGSKEQVASSPRIKVAADKAILLDPRNDVAWHVLGRWHQVLANIGGLKRAVGGLIYGKLPATTNEAAVTCFENAIAINPNRLRHHIELGRTYAQMGKNAEARLAIEKGLAMPNMEHDDPELKERGREALAKLP
tara:strand:+ start:148 stop:900 length:753 start_codon:yes stop_codon:yes gene_type:complete